MHQQNSWSDLLLLPVAKAYALATLECHQIADILQRLYHRCAIIRLDDFFGLARPPTPSVLIALPTPPLANSSSLVSMPHGHIESALADFPNTHLRWFLRTSLRGQTNLP